MAAALPATTREIEEFVAAAGWDQPTQVFALVDTAELLATDPNLADQLDPGTPLTPIAQDSMPADDLAEALARIAWPPQVVGCALVQEIVVLPPNAEEELPKEGEAARKAAAEHPERREARLVAAVLREGAEACLMRLRETDEEPGELLQDPSLAPNLLNALKETFSP